ncbi:unnamed protein product [Ectocarpus sp. 12 AP-2014]
MSRMYLCTTACHVRPTRILVLIFFLGGASVSVNNFLSRMMVIEVSASCATPPRVVGRRCRPPCSTRFGQMDRRRGLWTDGCLVFCRPSEARGSTFGTFACFPGAKEAMGCSRCEEEDT